MSVPDVAALVGTAAAEAGDRLAVVEAGGRGMTWAELDAEVSRVAGGLGAAGIVAGHRVMLALGNRLEFVTAYLGVLRAQAVAVPVNPASTRGELARMLADSGARMVIAEPDTIGAVREAVAAAQGRRAGRCGRSSSARRRSPTSSRTTTSGPPSRGTCRRCPIPRSSPSCSTPAAPPGCRAR